MYVLKPEPFSLVFLVHSRLPTILVDVEIVLFHMVDIFCFPPTVKGSGMKLMRLSGFYAHNFNHW